MITRTPTRLRRRCVRGEPEARLDGRGDPLWPDRNYAVVNPTWRDRVAFVGEDGSVLALQEHRRVLAWMIAATNGLYPGVSCRN